MAQEPAGGRPVDMLPIERKQLEEAEERARRRQEEEGRKEEEREREEREERRRQTEAEELQRLVGRFGPVLFKDNRQIWFDGARYFLEQLAKELQRQGVLGPMAGYAVRAAAQVFRRQSEQEGATLLYSVRVKSREERERDPGADVGYVYVLRDHTGLYKIGSTKNAKGRINSHKSSNPSLKVMAVIPAVNCRWAEHIIHQIFDDWRIGKKKGRGPEWFNLPTELARKLTKIEHLPIDLAWRERLEHETKELSRREHRLLPAPDAKDDR